MLINHKDQLQLELAKTADIPNILKLHRKYQVNTIADVDRADGFVTTDFTHEQLTRLIEQENGICVAKIDDQIIAYVMTASWSFWEEWPLFSHMSKELPALTYKNHNLNTSNSYQYGPICIDKTYRGLGIFEKIFYYSLEHMSQRYPVMVSFINKTNKRSFSAHINKLGLDIINDFHFNNNSYYEVVCLTTKKPIQGQ